MESILFIADRSRENKLIQHVLDKKYSIILPDGRAEWEKSCDLIIADSMSLKEWDTRIEALKETQKPYLLPCLVILGRGEAYKQDHYIHIVDEVIRRPVDWAELNIRISNLLRIRRLSVESADLVHYGYTGERVESPGFNDSLTGLYSRRYFMEMLKRLNNANCLPISIILGDINSLKLINCALGHSKGDEVIRQAARVISGSCRRDDIIARWGGDEFAILLPKTSYCDALGICNRIKQRFSIALNNRIHISMAMGIAVKEDVDDSIERLINEAEGNLYRSKLVESASAHNAIIASLESTLQEKTCETKDHCMRMKRLALEMGRVLSLPQSTLDELSLLAELHDIGKVAIPENILSKKGSLTREEWEIIKKHPSIGYRIIKALPEMGGVAEAILYHHERWDGAGYPKGLKGKEIPLISRIVSIVDAFDVMVNGRPYKAPVTGEDALKEIRRCAGSQFDPELVKVFLSMSSYINKTCI